MELTFSRRSRNIPEGIFSLLNTKKEELLKAGRTVYNFSVGTPDFHPPVHIMEAMQKACEMKPSTMAAVLALPDEKVEEICRGIDGVVVCANYNCPGQLVISGEVEAIDAACEQLLAAGAKRAMKLKVGGAFHSPCMEPARTELAEAIERTEINAPRVPVYQNVDARPHTDPAEIKANLIAQLTAPVRWTQSVQNMIADGATEFIELGPGKVLQGLVGKIDRSVATSGRQ